MKKSFLLMAVFAAVVFSCKKPEPVPEQPADTETPGSQDKPDTPGEEPGETLPTTDPHSVDRTSILSGETVTLRFDTAVWKMAKDIKWSWKANGETVVKEGAEVTTPLDVDYLSVTDNSPVEVPVTRCP